MPGQDSRAEVKMRGEDRTGAAAICLSVIEFSRFTGAGLEQQFPDLASDPLQC